MVHVDSIPWYVQVFAHTVIQIISRYPAPVASTASIHQKKWLVNLWITNVHHFRNICSTVRYKFIQKITRLLPTTKTERSHNDDDNSNLRQGRLKRWIKYNTETFISNIRCRFRNDDNKVYDSNLRWGCEDCVDRILLLIIVGAL